MKISRLHVKGFRSLYELDIPLKDLAILIGKNNAGKSNVLRAIKLLFDSSSRDFNIDDFYKEGDKYVENIYLEIELSGVSDFLELVHEKHRSKISQCIEKDNIRLKREIVRSGEQITVKKLEIWLPDKQTFGTPTGIDAGLKQIIPEIIFIEAFKDPSQEAQGKSSATLGKLLRLILEQVVSQIQEDVQNALNAAARRLNIFEDIDERPEELKELENRIKTNIRDIFEDADIQLYFELPKIGDLLGKATILLKDRHGPWTRPEFKGQGFQRSLYLALLRTLAEGMREITSDSLLKPFILLYEEPEAFLHPSLQKELGDILEEISQNNQVIIATHSPIIITPNRVNNVIIVRQEEGENGSQTSIPKEEIFEENIEDKKLIELLKFTHSSEFLFADYVIVVEGPSDKSLIEAVWYILKKDFAELKGPIDLAVIDAGSKDTVYPWILYLKAMKINAKGIVDLDFVWRGAGNVLRSHAILSDLIRRWRKELEKQGLLDKDGKISDKRRAGQIMRNSFETELDKIREDLRQKDIWVLRNGESEDYFGLSKSSKGKYTKVNREVRSGEREIPDELKEVLSWVIET